MFLDAQNLVLALPSPDPVPDPRDSVEVTTILLFCR